jgi:hypothetical protein
VFVLALLFALRSVCLISSLVFCIWFSFLFGGCFQLCCRCIAMYHSKCSLEIGVFGKFISLAFVFWSGDV